MTSSKIRIQLILNNNANYDNNLVRLKRKKYFSPVRSNKDTGDPKLMWKCNPPMHFSVHIIASLYCKNNWCDLRPFFNYQIERLACEPYKTRDSTASGDKTRTCSLFTAVISSYLTAVCTLGLRDPLSYDFISMGSKTVQLELSAYAFLE